MPEQFKKYVVYMVKKTGGILPTGFTQVEYIHNGSNTTPYIDTGIYANGTDTYEIDLMFNSLPATRAVFGARTTANAGARVLWAGQDAFYPQYGDNAFDAKPVGEIIPVVNRRYQFKSSGPLSEVNVYGDSQKYYSDYESTGAFVGGKIIIFGLENAGSRDNRTAFMRLYGFRVTRNSVVIADFIPCVNPDGVAGVYDIVRNRFFGSANSGVFYTPYSALSLAFNDENDTIAGETDGE